MVIDAHGHVTAPDKLYVYKAGLISHRGAHGRGSAGATAGMSMLATTAQHGIAHQPEYQTNQRHPVQCRR